MLVEQATDRDLNTLVHPDSTSNLNMLWAHALTESLARAGLNYAIISPGSRSAPLSLAFAHHSSIQTLSVLDERSAAFFALGKALQNQQPVALICSSGTAAANYYPALIEAAQSNVPLLVLTADRPPELQGCYAPQTMDQTKLYGNYPRWQHSLALAEPRLEAFRYLRQTLVHAYQKCLIPTAGPVHINCPFRDPLCPIKESSEEIDSLRQSLLEKSFFEQITPPARYPASPGFQAPPPELETLKQVERGVIIVGPQVQNNPDQWTQCLRSLATSLGWPILSDALNPLRNYQNSSGTLVCNYDYILRDPEVAKALEPDMLLILGSLPTSKILRAWLEKLQQPTYFLANSDDNWDPLHLPTKPLTFSLDYLTDSLIDHKPGNKNYQENWLELESKAQSYIEQELETTEHLFEGKIAYLLSKQLPKKTPIHIANSMPIRDMEYFWQANETEIIPYFNRGVNGIDGTLSTALGVAYQNQATVLLTGDLSFLHDTNGLLLAQKLQGSLTVILIDNAGGGIFEHLPIAKEGENRAVENYIITPQSVDFKTLAQAYGVEFQEIKSWSTFIKAIQSLPQSGIRILYFQTDRKQDKQLRLEILNR